jgi:outer membrane lipoprotein-sorting protein
MHAGRVNLKTSWLLATMAFVAMRGTTAEAPPRPVADPAPVLEDIHRKMSSLNSVYFEFTQERQLKLFSEPLKSEGVMLIQRPDQIRWETTSPFQSILMGNRESVAQFEKEDGKWNKLKLGFPQMLRRVMEQMSLMHQGKMDALTADFNVSVATGTVAVVTLKPKDESVRSVLSSLEIHMLPDFSTTRQVVMNEPNGDLTRILFREEHRDVKFPPGTFDQNRPVDIAAVKKEIGREP